MNAPLKKVRKTKWLLLICSALLLALMAQWIYVQYSEEKRKFSSELQVIFQSSVLNHKDKLLQSVYQTLALNNDSTKIDITLKNINVYTDTKVEESIDNVTNESLLNNNPITINFTTIDELATIVDSVTSKHILSEFNKYYEQNDKNIKVNNLDEMLINLPPIMFNIEHYEWSLIKNIYLHIIVVLIIYTIILITFYILYKNMYNQALFAMERDTMINNISHELKTPVSTTKVILEALVNYNGLDDREKTTKYLSVAHYEMHRLEKMIERAMLIMTSETGKLELKLKKIGLREKFESIIDNFAPILREKKAKIYFQMDCEDQSLYLDELHFENSIHNIIDNALKYGGTNIDIYINESIDRQIVILIKDNGIGIPEEYRYKIFDKFFRVPNGDKHEVKGHGLGLNYTKQIIEAHKGKIYLDNSKSTCFVIILPKIT